MSDGWVVTDNDKEIARNGIVLQMQAHGINVESKKNKAFIDHQTEVIAAWAAQCRWQQNIIHKMTFGDKHENTR